MFQVNDKVVCVDDSNQVNSTVVGPRDHLVAGDVHCIRGFSIGTYEPGVLLVGVTAGRWRYGTEAGFKFSRFRKVSEVQSENRLRREKRARTA